MKSINLTTLIRVTHRALPYLALELLLPGGSVIALLSWLYRRKSRAPLPTAVQHIKSET